MVVDPYQLVYSFQFVPAIGGLQEVVLLLSKPHHLVQRHGLADVLEGAGAVLGGKRFGLEGG